MPNNRALTVQPAPSNFDGQLRRRLDGLPTLVAELISTGGLPEVVAARANTETLRYHAKRAKLGKEALDICAEARLRLEGRLGELLPDWLKTGRPKKVGSDDHLRLKGSRHL